MPFSSKAQQRYLFAKRPRIAKEFAAETTNYRALPEKKSEPKPKKKKYYGEK